MIGQKIKKLRNKKGLLQKELADKLNLSQQTISLYESEKREPDYATLKKIADFFDVSTDYLLGRASAKEFSNEKIKVSEKSNKYDNILEEIHSLSPESQEELKKLIELYKLRDMQKRNSELSDDLTSTE